MEVEVKTQEQKQAWLDGYKAAYNTAKSLRVRVGHEEVDEAINHGSRMVASLLKSQIEFFEGELDD